MQTEKQKQGFAALKITEDAMKKARKRGDTAAYKRFKETRKKILTDLFYALVFLLVGYTGNSVLRNYNEHPTVKGTQMEMVGDTLQVTNTEESSVTVVSQTEKSEPIKVEEKQIHRAELESKYYPNLLTGKFQESSQKMQNATLTISQWLFKCVNIF